MRVGLVCFSSTSGGLELATLQRGAELLAAGHHVTAILPDAPALRERAVALGLTVDALQPTLPYLDLPAARKLAAIIAREGHELLLVGRTRDLSTAMLAAGRHVAVVLYQQMQSGVDKRDWFHNKVYRRLDGCIAITRQLGREIATNTLLDQARVDVVPYPVDAERFAPSEDVRHRERSALELDDETFVVGMLGGFDPGKGQLDLIEAMTIAAGEDAGFARSAALVIAGERPGDRQEYREEVRRRAAELELGGGIHLLPFRADPAPLYQALDLFVMPSHSETFGMVLQEALASGRAAIATDSEGVRELTRDGADADLVPARDPARLAEKILELWRDPARRQHMGDTARRSVIERYDPEHLRRQFEEAMERGKGRR